MGASFCSAPLGGRPLADDRRSRRPLVGKDAAKTSGDALVHAEHGPEAARAPVRVSKSSARFVMPARPPASPPPVLHRFPLYVPKDRWARFRKLLRSRGQTANGVLNLWIEREIALPAEKAGRGETCSCETCERSGDDGEAER
jgi:hypothetical protein